jgi:hypothetical protein
MEIEMDCPACPGRLSFTARRTRGAGRLVGSCDACRSVFTLFGGRVAPVEAPVAPGRLVGSVRPEPVVGPERFPVVRGLTVPPALSLAD